MSLEANVFVKSIEKVRLAYFAKPQEYDISEYEQIIDIHIKQLLIANYKSTVCWTDIIWYNSGYYYIHWV